MEKSSKNKDSNQKKVMGKQNQDGPEAASRQTLQACMHVLTFLL